MKKNENDLQANPYRCNKKNGNNFGCHFGSLPVSADPTMYSKKTFVQQNLSALVGICSLFRP